MREAHADRVFYDWSFHTFHRGVCAVVAIGMGANRVERAEMTEEAKREPDGILTYPALL
jgi:hypothetical protein